MAVLRSNIQIKHTFKLLRPQWIHFSANENVIIGSVLFVEVNFDCWNAQPINTFQ